MSDQTTPPMGPDDKDGRVLAAEYALGLLTDAERTAFETRLAEDSELASP